MPACLRNLTLDVPFLTALIKRRCYVFRRPAFERPCLFQRAVGNLLRFKGNNFEGIPLEAGKAISYYKPEKYYSN